MKKLIPILATATLIGCGGSDDNNNPPTLPTATIYTSNATQFHEVENSSSKFSGNLSCSDYVRQIGEGEDDLPELGLLFEFNENLQGGQCRLEEVVSTEKDLFLKGYFWGFTLHTEGSDTPLVVDCEILRVPMYDHSAGNDQLQCLASGDEDGDSTTNYGLSLANNGDLYFIKRFNHIETNELWRFNRNEQLTKITELEFNTERRPNSFRTYTTTGDYVLIIGDGGADNNTIVRLNANTNETDYFQWESNSRTPYESVVGNLVFTNLKNEGYLYFNLDTGEDHVVEHFEFPRSVFGTPEGAFTFTRESESDLSYRQTLMEFDLTTNTLRAVDPTTQYDSAIPVVQGESEVVFIKYIDDFGDIDSKARIGYIDSDSMEVNKEDLLFGYEQDFQSHRMTPIAGGVKITDADPENYPMTVYISTHNFEAFESEEEFQAVLQTIPVQKIK